MTIWFVLLAVVLASEVAAFIGLCVLARSLQRDQEAVKKHWGELADGWEKLAKHAEALRDAAVVMEKEQEGAIAEIVEGRHDRTIN